MWIPNFHDGKWVWWEWLTAPVVIPLGMAYGMIALGGAIVFLVPIMCVWGLIDSAWFHWLLIKQNRILRWETLEPALITGKGTLIVVENVKTQETAAIWWTPENVFSDDPAE